jgi:4a-hydroxytetrahydrobiopterin dehydratase
MLLAMATIDASEAQRRLESLSGWSLEGVSIRRQFSFPGFPEAVAFIVRLGFAAEAADHHPDMLVNYKRVTLTYTTHSEHGLTDKDFAGAETATALARSMGGG